MSGLGPPMLIFMKPGESSLLGKLKFLAGLFWLATTAAGFAGGEEKMWLGGADPLFERDDYYDNGYALRTITPIKDLPKRIVFKPGEVSLVADPTDHRGKYMVAYLINDTDSAIEHVVGELHEVASEVKFGGHWFDREEQLGRCGSVRPPAELPPRNALVLGACRSDLGDTGGEIRFRFHIPGRTVTTEVMRGRYFAERINGFVPLSYRYGPLSEAIKEGLINNDWSRSRAARNLEECCAILELARHHTLAVSERAALIDWMLDRTAKRDASPEVRRAISRMRVVLSRPWLIVGDLQFLADRAISAFESKKFAQYGSPERCRAAVWRYLTSIEGEGDGSIRNDGMGVDLASQKRLVEIAVADLDAADPEVGNAAAVFLVWSFCSKDLVPVQVFNDMLEHPDENRELSGLCGLGYRGRSAEAGPWLLKKGYTDPLRALRFYDSMRTWLRDEMAPWEIELLRILIERKPFETFCMLDMHQRGVPVDCRDLIRGFLKRQLSELDREWWEQMSDRDSAGQLTSVEKGCIYGLGNAIRLVDSWNEEADIELIRGFLDHPAVATTKLGDGSGLICYVARAAAKDALQRRKLAVPPAVVTELRIAKPVPPRDRSGDFPRFVLRYQKAIAACCGLALVMGVWWLWKLRLGTTV